MVDLKNVEKIAKDIKDITIQWATNIAREACKIMEQELRNQKFSDSNEVKDYGGIEIDSDGRTVKIDGKQIELSLREYELLKYLVENSNIALSRDKILNNVWNYDYYGDSRTIDSHIKKIRHKLGKKGKYIQTMRGVGYKFEVK